MSVRNRVLIAVVCTTFLGLGFSGGVEADETKAETVVKTRLRASTPNGTFSTSRGATRLTRVEIEVRNVGDVMAKEIKVSVDVPGSGTYPAYGASELAPHSSSIYIARPSVYIVKKGRLKATADCGNCYH